MDLFLLLSLMGFLSKSDLPHVDLCVCDINFGPSKPSRSGWGGKFVPALTELTDGNQAVPSSPSPSLMQQCANSGLDLGALRGREGQGEEITPFSPLSAQPSPSSHGAVPAGAGHWAGRCQEAPYQGSQVAQGS